MVDNAQQAPLFELYLTEHELNYLNMLVQTDAAVCRDKAGLHTDDPEADVPVMYATDAAIADALVERIENILDRIDEVSRPAAPAEQ